MAWNLVLQTEVLSSFVKFVPHLRNKNSTHCILSSANWQKSRDRHRNIYGQLVLSKWNALSKEDQQILSIRLLSESGSYTFAKLINILIKGIYMLVSSWI